MADDENAKRCKIVLFSLNYLNISNFNSELLIFIDMNYYIL